MVTVKSKTKKPTSKKEAKGSKQKVKSVSVEQTKIDVQNSRVQDGKEKYYQAIGRRKESVANIRLYTMKSSDKISEDKALIKINNEDYHTYFPNKNQQLAVESPFRKLKSMARFKATVKVSGGGISGQAGSVKHGIARALVEFDENFKKKLRKAGFLTRDPRTKERRKYGLKKARKSPQWQKR